MYVEYAIQLNIDLINQIFLWIHIYKSREKLSLTLTKLDSNLGFVKIKLLYTEE